MARMTRQENQGPNNSFSFKNSCSAFALPLALVFPEWLLSGFGQIKDKSGQSAIFPFFVANDAEKFWVEPFIKVLSLLKK